MVARIMIHNQLVWLKVLHSMKDARKYKKNKFGGNITLVKLMRVAEILVKILGRGAYWTNILDIYA